MKIVKTYKNEIIESNDVNFASFDESIEHLENGVTVQLELAERKVLNVTKRHALHNFKDIFSVKKLKEIKLLNDKKAQKRNRFNISFEEYCSEMFDLDLSLMTKEEISQASKSFNS